MTPTDKEAEAIYQQMLTIVDDEERLLAFAIENKPTFDKLKVAGMCPSSPIEPEHRLTPPKESSK